MQVFSSKLLFNLLSFCWVTLILFLRPSILGSYFNKEIFVLLLLTTFIIIIFAKSHIIKLELNKITLYLLILVLFLYFIIQGLILSTSVGTVINASLFMGGIVGVLFLMSTLTLQKRFVKVYVLLHFALALSAIISLLLLTIFSIDQLSYIKFEVIDYSKTSRYLTFPFSFFWSKFNLPGIHIPLFTAIYKEPGLAQAFMITAFWMSVAGKYKSVIKVVLFIGAIITFSTAGLLIIVISTFVYFVTRKRSIISYFYRYPLISLTSILLIIAIGVVGYQQLEKKQKEESGESRIASYSRSINLLNDNPLFGTGFYSIRDSDGSRKDETSSLGLIGVAFQIGYVGIILYLIIWAYAFIIFNNGHFLYLYLPFFITILLFQPNYNSPIIWMLLSLNFENIFTNHQHN